MQSAKSTGDLRAVLRKYIEDILAEGVRARFAIPVGYAVYGLGTEPPPGRDIVELDRATIAVALDDARGALAASGLPPVWWRGSRLRLTRDSTQTANRPVCRWRSLMTLRAGTTARPRLSQHGQRYAVGCRAN